MKVFVTGVTGGVGKIAARCLSAAGAQVIGFSRRPAEVAGVSEFRAGDVTDYEGLKAAMSGCDEVVHLAAYHMPYDAPEQEMFGVNVGGTFNVFKACAELGINRVTVASSPNAIGYNFGVYVRDISYLPVDGDHPLYTTDPYSFTKQEIEEVGRYFYRRHGISSVFMRLGLDFRTTIEEWAVSPARERERSLRKLVDGLLALPGKEGAREVRRIENDMDRSRHFAKTSAPPFKNGTEYVYESFSDELKVWGYLVHNFLMYLDGRDLGESVVCSLNSGFSGSHVIFVADHKNMLGVESIKLANLLYPGAKANIGRLNGYDSLVDCDSTKKLIGFYARRTVADYYGVIYG
jgi:NAD(P)-dependent dehydrogenase (short-subunit alcohol dehydrogenase family)